MASTNTPWDVFLSFRGKDTRYTFTDHLYKALHRTGIRTFMDDPELRRGEVISDSLVQAIQDSKAYIVVLSENYASSSWCLDELVEILTCHKQMKRLVVPLFYNIDPSVVRHQLESFIEAFNKHRSRFETEKVDKWRLTLNEVANFSGYYISKTRSQADVIDEVVDRISSEINPRTLDVAKYPVGLDSRVKHVTALFNSNTEGVIKIGIHGMGGVGKTTLAKALYNQNYQRFQGSSFLANVREVSRTDIGLGCLQQQLINDVLKCKNIIVDNVDQGIELIRARICSTKVLIVIDDLDNPKPLEFLVGSFALGSMIVITTRNEDLLDSIKVQTRYKATELNYLESCLLFCQHAFAEAEEEDEVPYTFVEMSREILKHAGGLPLALKVFGSNLLNQPKEEWRWFIDKLSRVPIHDIEKKLMISFDALKPVDPMLQDIFLDIACFFVGHKKQVVVKIIETCYTFANRNIDFLIKRCLLTTNDNDELRMHDLLQDMGRTIASNNSPDEPGKHSRLWAFQDIHSVLKKHKGTKVIQGIILSYFDNEDALEQVSYDAATFKRMKKLRFLYLNKVNLTGSFEHTFGNLRWLCWKNFPLQCLPSEFHAQKLVTLELPHSEMRMMWELNVVPKVFDNLKILCMVNCRNLTTTPDFTRFPCLEFLNLEGCSSLEEVHVSIGNLERLVCLHLVKCSNLTSLPDSICRLRALEEINISGCSRLEALPRELGNIESLKQLIARGLLLPNYRIQKLPDSIGRLSNLVKLYLSYFENLEILPDSICSLKSLELLYISNCGMLKELPDQLGMIKSLKSLILLAITLLKMIPDISQLSNLEQIVAQGCTSLEKLPNLSNLKQLVSLNVEACSSLTEIQGLQELTSLEHLAVRFCNNLFSVSKLPSNLKWIDAYECTSMKILPDLSNLIQLERLDLTNCNGLTEIKNLEKLTSLRELYLIGCNSSLLAHFTKRLFQIFSGFGHKCGIYFRPGDFQMEWINEFKVLKASKMSLNLQPNESHNFLAIIFCFYTFEKGVKYTVKNITSGFIWSDIFHPHGGCGSSVVIVPSSILSFRDGDDEIEITTSKKVVYGIHLLYKTEITMLDEYASTIFSLHDDERSYSYGLCSLIWKGVLLF